MGRPALRFVLALVTAWLASSGPASAQLGSLLSPGRLAKGHEKLEGIANCTQCHESGRRVTVAKCLACHAPIAQRIARKTGVHRDVRDDCVACHADHAGVNGELRPFDTKSFDHTAHTAFALDGKHRNVEGGCPACHKQRTFLDLRTACVGCHQDIHKPTLGTDCQDCHSTKVTFKEVQGFDHTKSAFQLTGAHRDLSCEQCHPNQQFRGVAFATCGSCHRDPHKPVQVTRDVACASCHRTDSWRSRQFDHGRASFMLKGAHDTVDCVACHKQAAMRVKPRADTCEACHADPHRGVFAPQDCNACHNESTFAKAPFDHSATRFRLTGRHVPLDCEACHKRAAPPPGTSPIAAPARSTATRPAITRPAAGRVNAGPRTADRALDFRGLSGTCVSCHIDVHQAQLGEACERCHSADTFKVPTFTHTNTPNAFFGGQHERLTCQDCHQPAGPSITQPLRTGAPLIVNVRYRGVRTACVTCHQDVHLGQEGTQCESCHTLERAKFSVPAFPHAQTAFPLTGKHEATACAKCHKREHAAFPAGRGEAVRFKGVGLECVACHRDVHLGQLDGRCEQCHSTRAFAIGNYTHRNARQLARFFAGAHARQTCDGCHRPSSGQFPAGRGTAVRFTVETSCIACHTDVHGGALGRDCANCHRL